MSSNRCTIALIPGSIFLVCFKLQCFIAWGSLWCPGIGSSDRSSWICGRFLNEPIPKPLEIRWLVVYGVCTNLPSRSISFSGGSAGLTTCTILHVSLKWTWEIYSTPQLRVLRKHFEEFWIYLCLEYGVALSNFHSFLFSGKWDAICGWQCKWPRLPTQRKRLPNSMRCQQSLWPKGHPWEHPRLQDVKGP